MFLIKKVRASSIYADVADGGKRRGGRGGRGGGKETNLQLRERRFSLSQLISFKFRQLLQPFLVLGKSRGVAANVQALVVVLVVAALVSELAAVAL